MENEKHTKAIIDAFNSLQTKDDLLKLLNFVKSVIWGEKAFPFTMRQLNYYAFSSVSSNNRYTQFSIKKKSGGERVISSPTNGLKAIQTCLNHIFQLVYTPHPSAKGFVRGESIVANAQEHIGQLYVYNIDLKDFFLSVESGRIYKRLCKVPFNLTPIVASTISDLCCHPMSVERMNDAGEFVKVARNVLPQGAPTSPTLTNLVCDKMDYKLSLLANKFGLRYTRYADDITFSGMYNAFKDNSDFTVGMRKIIAGQGFYINDKKTRLQKRGQRQEVTGLIVSKNKVNVTRKYISDLRGMIHFGEKNGLEALQKEFSSRQVSVQSSQKESNKAVHVENVISGKLMFLQMVKGSDDSTYVSLKNRFYRLAGIQHGTDTGSTNADSISSIFTSPNPTEADRMRLLETIVKRFKCDPNVLKADLRRLGTASYKTVVKQLHDPLCVIKLLEQFSAPGALKYTTHDWDKASGSNEFEYTYEKLVEEYSDLLSSFLPTLISQYNAPTGNLLRKYLLQNNIDEDGKPFEWGKDNIKIGFAFPSDVMKNWLDENPGKDPFAMPLDKIPDEYRPTKIAGKVPLYFRQVADAFKGCTSYRDNKFYFAVKNISKCSDYEVDAKKLETLRGITFYTNTFEIEQALRIIFENIKNRYDVSRVVEIEVKNDDPDVITLEILHVNSFIDTDINDPKLNLCAGLSSQKGQFMDIKKHLQSLAEWSVEGKFKNSQEGGDSAFYRIEYLNSKRTKDYEAKPTHIPLPDSYEIENEGHLGFKHILKFYR